MYALFYCDAFPDPYQLCRLDLGLQANGWHHTISGCLLDLHFTAPSSAGNVITTPAARIQRFEDTHKHTKHTKQLKLLAEAPSVEAFYELYPELFI